MGGLLGEVSGGYVTAGSAPLANKNRLPAQGHFRRGSVCASNSEANPPEREQGKARSGEPGDLDDPPGAAREGLDRAFVVPAARSAGRLFLGDLSGGQRYP